jgi:hypothetical protein
MLITSERRTEIPGSFYDVVSHMTNHNEYPNLPENESVTFYRLPILAKYEIITPNSEGSHQVPKAFEHYKRVFEQAEFEVGRTFNRGQGGGYITAHHATTNDPCFGYDYRGFGEVGKFDKDLPKFFDLRADGGFVPAPAGLDDLTQRALNTMLPVLKAELSLVNSLIELKDFVSLPRTLKRIADFRFLPSLRRKGIRATLRELLGGSADGYLQAKFNVLPLLSDIRGVRTALLRSEKRINAFITRQGRVQKRHFSLNWREYPDVSDSYAPKSPIVPSLWYNDFDGYTEGTRQVIHDATTFHAEMLFNFNYTAYQVEHARLLSLMDQLGLSLDPRIIWNAIPWSFVVDWVIDVNRWLSQFRISNMEPVINILHFLWSVKRARRITVQTKVGTSIPEYHSPAPQWGPVGITFESSYRRWVGMPSTSSVQLSGLNPTEFSLGAALVVSRRRHQNNRKRN